MWSSKAQQPVQHGQHFGLVTTSGHGCRLRLGRSQGGRRCAGPLAPHRAWWSQGIHWVLILWAPVQWKWSLAVFSASARVASKAGTPPLPAEAAGDAALLTPGAATRAAVSSRTVGLIGEGSWEAGRGNREKDEGEGEGTGIERKAARRDGLAIAPVPKPSFKSPVWPACWRCFPPVGRSSIAASPLLPSSLLALLAPAASSAPLPLCPSAPLLCPSAPLLLSSAPLPLQGPVPSSPAGQAGEARAGKAAGQCLTYKCLHPSEG